MSLGYGYAGKLLTVDLTTGAVTHEPLSRELQEGYLGGKGFGARILYDQLPPHCGPLSPENILVFAAGPLTGTLAPSSSRFEVCTKGPETGLWLDTNTGGHFGPELKFAGYDVLVVSGRSPSPGCLLIEDGRVSLSDANHLWGMDTIETHKRLKKDLGGGYRICCIGPAGERGAPMACIISEYRALGRGGAGAVMGSKNLKAICVRGTGGIRYHDPDRFVRTCKEAFNELTIHPDTGGGRQKYGTNVILSTMKAVGLHPERNYQTCDVGGEKTISEEKIEAYYTRHRACFGCPIYCSKIAEVKEGPYGGSFTEGPEYENVWAFGAQCGNTDVDATIHAEYLCDKYGLDAISTGHTIGFLMECVEKGIMTASDIGFPLEFGDHGAMIRMMHLMGKRQGPGHLWSQGVRRIAEEFPASTDFAMHVKGMELPAYDPRGSTGMALAYATSDRGGCHLRSWPIGEELLAMEERMDPLATEYKAELVKNQQDLFCAINCSGMCLFATFALSLKQITPFLKAATGLEAFSASEDIMRIGERVNMLVRQFNIREGLTRAMDTLPERFFKEPMNRGPCKGRTVALTRLLSEYYDVRGWDPEGVPTEEKLAELNLTG